MRFNKIYSTAILLFASIAVLKAQVTTVPFSFTGTHLFVKLQVNQSDSLNFVFDSGSTGASIDSAVAEKIGVSKENTLPVSMAGSGGSQSYMMVLNQSLKLQGTVINNVNLVLINFKGLSAAVGTRIDGIVGYEILNKYITKIDFDLRRMTIYDQMNAVDTTGYTGIPFEFSKGILIPRFPVSITLASGDTFTGKVMFDTGNAFSLIVSPPFSKFHNFNAKLGETNLSEGRGMNAITRDKQANIQSMSFNGFNLGKMGIRLTVNEDVEARDGYLGILGIEVLKRFNMIIDYGHRKIYLKPNNGYNEPLKQFIPRGLSNPQSKFFLENNKKKEGIQVTKSGLQYQILKDGKGPVPGPGDRVTLHYTVSSFKGEKLWSTYDNNKPWIHRLDKTLAGVREAVLMMPIGSKWILYLPANLAFGDDGFENIKPGDAILYEVELINSEK